MEYLVTYTHSKFIIQTENKNSTVGYEVATHVCNLSQLSTHSSGMLSSSLWTTGRGGHLWLQSCFLTDSISVLNYVTASYGTGCNSPCTFFSLPLHNGYPTDLINQVYFLTAVVLSYLSFPSSPLPPPSFFLLTSFLTSFLHPKFLPKPGPNPLHQ